MPTLSQPNLCPPSLSAATGQQLTCLNFFSQQNLDFFCFFLSLCIYLWQAETSQQPISQTTWLKVIPQCNHCNHYQPISCPPIPQTSRNASRCTATPDTHHLPDLVCNGSSKSTQVETHTTSLTLFAMAPARAHKLRHTPPPWPCLQWLQQEHTSW